MEHLLTKESLILNYLQELYPESSSNTLRSWIRAGRVSADGKVVAKANQQLAKGSVVTVGPKVGFLTEGIKVLFEDDDLIVLEKPEGILSVATDFDNTVSVHSILKKRFHKQRVFPVHRLDRETSGVMVFAYTDFARRRLKEQFQKHTIEKTYYAIIEGELHPPKGTWESYLEEDALYSVSSTTDKIKGKLAITHYEQIATNHRYSLLRLMPVTGKKHQLRVHCKEAGVPIIGDPRYGRGFDPIQRLCLHAKKISFTHPSSQKRMSFEVAFPLSFDKLVVYSGTL